MSDPKQICAALAALLAMLIVLAARVVATPLAEARSAVSLVEAAAEMPWEQCVINDRSAAIRYTPMDRAVGGRAQEGWIHANLGSQMVNQSYDSDNHRTTLGGATATLEFSGSQIKVFVQGVPRGGLAEVRIDGGEPELVDTASPERLDYMLVYEKYGLTPGQHRLEIKVLGQSSHGRGGNWFQLDFFDTSELPVVAPFTAEDIEADFTSVSLRGRVASWGEKGREGVTEVGFALNEMGSPAGEDWRVPASLAANNVFLANVSDLSPDTEYRVRPYLVVDQRTYYGRSAIKATKPLIELSDHTLGLLVGESRSIALTKMNAPDRGVSWQVVSEQTFDGRDRDIVDVTVNAWESGITVVGKAEGEAVIRVPSKADANISTEIAVTVARREKNANVALTPPMGWNSWNVFGRVVDSQKIRDTIDSMVTPITSDGKSLKDLGYEYVVIDGGWRQNWLEPDGSIVPNSYFGGQQGMKELADYAHGKGLKIGLHVLPGVKDCAGQYVGAKGNEHQHLAQYAEWGIDFLKWDKCGGYGDDTSAENMYKRMKYFMDNTGSDVLFSVCNYAFTDWAPAVGHMWRTTGDIKTSVNSAGASWSNIIDIVAKNGLWWRSAEPGAWNDPDIMVVGDPGLGPVEWASHFNLWAMMAAPLMLGLDLSNLQASSQAVEIISNSEVIAINQDALGKQGRPVKKSAGFEVWAKPLADGSMAILLLNSSTQVRDITVDWVDVFYDANHRLDAGAYEVRDLGAHRNLGVLEKSFRATNVPVHGPVMLRVCARRE